MLVRGHPARPTLKRFFVLGKLARRTGRREMGYFERSYLLIIKHRRRDVRGKRARCRSGCLCFDGKSAAHGSGVGGLGVVGERVTAPSDIAGYSTLFWMCVPGFEHIDRLCTVVCKATEGGGSPNEIAQYERFRLRCQGCVEKLV